MSPLHIFDNESFVADQRGFNESLTTGLSHTGEYDPSSLQRKIRINGSDLEKNPSLFDKLFALNVTQNKSLVSALASVRTIR